MYSLPTLPTFKENKLKEVGDQKIISHRWLNNNIQELYISVRNSGSDRDSEN